MRAFQGLFVVVMGLSFLGTCVTSSTSDPNDPCSQVKSSGGPGAPCTTREECAQTCCACSTNPEKKFGASSCNVSARECENPADLCSEVEAADPSLCMEPRG